MTEKGKSGTAQNGQEVSPVPPWFDLEAMKRRFGAPPLFGRTNIREFDEFMLSLAGCMQFGDSMVALYVYQYGLEQFKMIMLLNWQSEALSHLPSFKARENAAIGEAERLRKQAQKARALHKDIIAPGNNAFIESNFLNDSIYGEIMSGIETSAVEIRISRHVERGLRNYARIDRMINDCSKRAKQALARIEAHSRELAERLYEEAMDNVRYAEPIPEGLKDVTPAIRRKY